MAQNTPPIQVTTAYLLQHLGTLHAGNTLRLMLKEASILGLIRSRMEQRTFYAHPWAGTLGYGTAFLMAFVLPSFLFWVKYVFFLAVVGPLLKRLAARYLPPTPGAPDWCIERTGKTCDCSDTLLFPLIEAIQRAIETNKAQSPGRTDCTFAELLVAIEQNGPSGGEFLDHYCLLPLMQKGLLSVTFGNKVDFEAKILEIGKTTVAGSERTYRLRKHYGSPRHRYTLTDAGRATLDNVQAVLATHAHLHNRIRTAPHTVADSVQGLGTGLLLLPDLEGHYAELVALLEGKWVQAPDWWPGIVDNQALLDGEINDLAHDFSYVPIYEPANDTGCGGCCGGG